MTINEYQQRAMATLNPKLTEQDVLINSVMGLCGESGEAIDIVKKWLAQGHPLDREHLAGELGDVAWYLAGTPGSGILRARVNQMTTHEEVRASLIEYLNSYLNGRR